MPDPRTVRAEQLARKYHSFITNPCPPEHHQFRACPVVIDFQKEILDALAAEAQAAARAQREADVVVCENIGKEIVCPEECAAAIRTAPLVTE